MRKYLLLLSLIVYIPYAVFAQEKLPFQLPNGITSSDIVKGSILVKVKNTGNTALRTSGASGAFDQIAQTVSIREITQLYPIQRNNNLRTSAQAKEHRLKNWYRVSLADTANLVSQINKILSLPGVAHAEPEYKDKLLASTNDPLEQNQGI